MRLVFLACFIHLSASAHGTATSADMQLYDDARSEYALRVVSQFKLELDKLQPDRRMRNRLLRSVDVMSYTVGMQASLERAPPLAIVVGVGETTPGRTAGDGGEGAAIWCSTPNSSDPQAHELRILDRLFAGLGNKGLRGLDIGSGYGGWVRLLSLGRSEVAHVTGIEYQQNIHDISRFFTEYAFDRTMDELSEQISLKRADVRDWLAADDGPQVDFVVSFLALLHIGSTLADKSSLMAQAGNKLRVGGRIYFEDIVVLPGIAAGGEPSYAAKVRRVIWMNALTTHRDWAQLVTTAGLGPVASAAATATTFDVTAAWRDFVLTRARAFSKVDTGMLLCLDSNGGVSPSGTQQCIAVKRLGEVLNDKDLADAYLKSQMMFFCEVCELFWGRGSLAEADCKCPENVDSEAEEMSHPKDHPPLVGGAIIFAEKSGKAEL